MSTVQAGEGKPEESQIDHAILLDELPAMVASWGPDGRNRFANAFFLQFLGLTPEQIQGRHIRDVMDPERFEANRPSIEAALAGEAQLLHRKVTAPDGEVRHVQLSYVPHVREGRPDGFHVLGAEVSALVHAEQALQDSVRQVALLEERQRIAADLHDLVIQRLFAVGLELGALAREVPDLAPRVQSAAVGVDEAIRELRVAIHSLRQLMTPTQVPASVEKILGNAGRMLGFMPSVTYTGSLDEIPSDVVQDLLAVLNEALSNVARHADASHVEVTLSCADGRLLLVVADNGRGILDADRSSGLSNMRRRAERHRGTFRSRVNVPGGTVVEWMVPTGTP